MSWKVNTIDLLKATYEENDILPDTIASELFWELDSDMNGNNGEEYLWKDARENGFDCNLDYITSLYKEKMNDSYYEWDDNSQIMDCIKHFKEFYDRQGYNYYQLGNAHISTKDDGKTWDIAIPYITYT